MLSKQERLAKRSAYNKKWWAEHRQELREQKRQYALEYRKLIKADVLTHYSNGKLACIQCGESRVACLSIDHIDGQGYKHRTKEDTGGGAFYRLLKKQGYPKGYQTLCMNCQFVKKSENNEYIDHWNRY